MKAAYYERTGPAADVLRIDRIPDVEPGEVRVRVHASGVNPSDVKARSGVFSRSDGFARIVPHSDAARLPLERIAEAHELVESGRAVGNVVVELGDAS